MGTLLEVKNLKKYYPVASGTLHAVDDVSFTLNKGETLGVVGESGCGKSTLGKTLLRLVNPTSGSVLYEGRDIAGISEREFAAVRPELQMIFQDPMSSLNPRMSVKQQIEEPLLIYKRFPDSAEREKKVFELMDTVGLARRYADMYPHELDGGRRQRIGIARGLSLEPKLIVCDEPVSALDVLIQAQILNLLQDLQREKGTSIIFITHDLGVINEMADDVAVMYCGQVVEKASAKLIFADCSMSHPYTEGLMFSIPRIDSIHEKIEPIPGVVPHPLALPKGCKFAPRCKYCTKKCMEEEPALVDAGEGQLIRCFYPEKEVRRSAEHKKIIVNQ